MFMPNPASVPATDANNPDLTWVPLEVHVTNSLPISAATPRLARTPRATGIMVNVRVAPPQAVDLLLPSLCMHQIKEVGWGHYADAVISSEPE
jgi:hypothetical protein